MQPHRSRYWLNADPLSPEAFREQAAVVCDLYERAGALAEQGRVAPGVVEKAMRDLKIDPESGDPRER